jgi:protein phosphatase
MTAEEAERSEIQNVIVRSLGVEDSVEPDLADHEFVNGDVLLLCCDGLSRFVPQSKMIEIIEQAETLDTACEQLVEAAKAMGSNDNITCVLVRTVAQSRKDRILNAVIPGRRRHRWQISG